MNKILALFQAQTPTKFIEGSIRYRGRDVRYIIALDLSRPERFSFKGGLRFSASETRQSLAKAALRLTEKAKLFDIPFRGAKAAILIDPTSDIDLNELASLWTEAVKDYLGSGPDAFIPAPDFGVPTSVATAIKDAYEKIIRRPFPDVVTGKPLEAGGHPMRADATGLGAFFCMEMLREKLALRPEAMTVGIAGMGKSTLPLIQRLLDAGYKIAGVSDSSACVLDPSDVGALLQLKRSGRKLSGPPADLLLSQPMTVLVLGAIADHVNQRNVNRVQATYILEIANNAVSAPFRNLIPSIVASSGGLLGSYYELAHKSSDEFKIDLERKMRSAFETLRFG